MDAQAVPPWADWPADAAILNHDIETRDIAKIREHGWRLWAWLSQQGADGWPVWRPWPTAGQIYRQQAKTAEPAVSTGPLSLIERNHANIDVNVPGPYYPPPDYVMNNYKACIKTSGDGTRHGLRDGPKFQYNGDILIVGVIYNDVAAEWIVSQGLNEAVTLNDMYDHGEGLEDIADFPAKSIVLKHMYWPIRGDSNNGPDGFTPLPVWPGDQEDPNPPIYVGYENTGYWPNAVAIDPSGDPVPPGQTANVKYLYGAIKPDGEAYKEVKYSNAKIVSVNDFYHRRLNQNDLDKMAECDRAILDASSIATFHRPFQAGDVIVSMAMHINTKEIRQWTLQSLWWSDNPNDGPYATNRPSLPDAKGPWQNYLMTDSYGVTVEPGGDTWPLAYNPYIELAASHTINTNCRNCHIRAGWPSSGFAEPDEHFTSYDGSSYAVSCQNEYDWNTVITLDACIFGPGNPSADDTARIKRLMRLDFQWSTADRAK